MTKARVQAGGSDSDKGSGGEGVSAPASHLTPSSRPESPPSRPESSHPTPPSTSLPPRPAPTRASPSEARAPFHASVLTLLPEAFPGTLGLGLHGKALQKGLWSLEVHDIRRHGRGTHRAVDAPPYGGGPGMVLRADVLEPALQEVASNPGPLLYLSPRGTPFNQSAARRLAAASGVKLLCGRYEGVDQRILDAFCIEEVSLGDFILSGGEVAALALLETVVRLIPGVLGNQTSIQRESFTDGLLEHPHYTRPPVWNQVAVPEVLRQGCHESIERWRHQAATELTRTRRPDLQPEPNTETEPDKQPRQAAPKRVRQSKRTETPNRTTETSNSTATTAKSSNRTAKKTAPARPRQTTTRTKPATKEPAS